MDFAQRFAHCSKDMACTTVLWFDVHVPNSNVTLHRDNQRWEYHGKLEALSHRLERQPASSQACEGRALSRARSVAWALQHTAACYGHHHLWHIVLMHALQNKPYQYLFTAWILLCHSFYTGSWARNLAVTRV